MGVVLFVCVLALNPFKEANPKTDPFYKAIFNNKSGAFWRAFDKVRDKKLPALSDEFKSLTISLLQYEPNQRPTIAEILNHPWF